MIESGSPFWWINWFYDNAIKALENFYGISTSRSSHTLSSNAEAVNLVQNDLSDHGRVGSKVMQSVRKDLLGDTLPGEVEFFERVQTLLYAIRSGNREAAGLMVQSVRKHFDSDEKLRDANWEFEDNGGENRTQLMAEADDFEQQAKLLLA
ncbi:hypothetical protein [Shimazuella alba]|uniref:Uncharacterized protein n=1 Tax=Shimazuella alba TaxID=2690964 RepID=A0A6I4VQ99_9BACL|nr:hypothetical protein [Shimazuella alba]MXQ52561.1 hypothetical protein [Shimazuella alba]